MTTYDEKMEKILEVPAFFFGVKKSEIILLVILFFGILLINFIPGKYPIDAINDIIIILTIVSFWGVLYYRNKKEYPYRPSKAEIMEALKWKAQPENLKVIIRQYK